MTHPYYDDAETSTDTSPFAIDTTHETNNTRITCVLQVDQFCPASKEQRIVHYEVKDYQLTIPQMFYSESSLAGLPHPGPSALKPPPAPHRRHRFESLPHVYEGGWYPSPEQELSPLPTIYADLQTLHVNPPPSAPTTGRRSSHRTRHDTTQEDHRSAEEITRFNFWLSSVLADLYPPKQIQLIKEQLLQMPIHPNDYESEIIAALLPEGMHRVFIYLRQTGRFPPSRRSLAPRPF